MSRLVVAVALSGLAACGDNVSPEYLPTSTSLAERCASPRPGGTIDPLSNSPYGDVQGTVADEKAFLRSWIDETYLWYEDVRALSASTLDADNYTTPLDYFNALKTPLITASGAPKDKFHFVYDTPTWVALSTAGVSYGYGFDVALVEAAPPRDAVIAFTDPGTPATDAGIARGASVLTVDGVDLQNGSDVDTLNAGLFPTAPGDHTFVIQDLGATTPRTVTLTAQSITETPVQNVMTLPAPYTSVGYLLFNDHIATAESELIDAITTLQGDNVTDLVLDIRYNGGGYLDIASELAYMIAGPTATAGKFFERETYNDKNPFMLTEADDTTDFHATASGFSATKGIALPALSLPRVFVLVTGSTCSASEAIINGLRGAGITVNLIGGTTCGKPYGFFPQDNCGTTYFSIEFQGVNFLSFGDYPDGFMPNCMVADDFGHALGDPAEGMLSAALALMSTGSCPAAVSASAHHAQPQLMRSPLRENRILRHPPR